MPEQPSQLSYQTTMPEYPDVTYQTWVSQHGGSHGGRLGKEIYAWSQGSPNYQTWRQNLLDDYNARMSAYNTWLSTGAGKRASALSGGYNPSYFDAGQASASPLSYQDVNPGSGVSEMAQGISGVFNFIQALQGMKMVTAQIAGQELKNEQQKIINDQLAENLKWKNTLLFNQGKFAGYRADDQAFNTASHLFSIYRNTPFVGNEAFSPFGVMSYDLKPFKDSPVYQRAWADLAFVRAGTSLRNAQAEMARWSSKEKKWFSDNLWDIQKKILNNQLTLSNGEVDFQKVRQQLYKSGQIVGMSTQVVNTAVNALKSFLTPAGLLGGNGTPQQGPNPSMFTSPYSPLGSGMDLSGYGAFGSY